MNIWDVVLGSDVLKKKDIDALPFTFVEMVPGALVMQIPKTNTILDDDDPTTTYFIGVFKDAKLSIHGHDYIESILVLDGQIRNVTTGEVWNKDEIWVINPYEFHEPGAEHCVFYLKASYEKKDEKYK